MLLFLHMYRPPRNDMRIGYSSTGIVPAVSKYCSKINKNVIYKKI